MRSPPAIALVVSLAIWAASCGGDDAATPSQSPTAQSTFASLMSPSVTFTQRPSPTPILPEFMSTIPVTTIELGPSEPFPDDVLLYVQPGNCCEGPAQDLVRVYRPRGGQPRAESLASAFGDDLAAVGNPAAGGQPFAGMVGSADGSEIVIEICTEGLCATLGEPDPSSRSRFIRSTDGGVTWHDWGAPPPASGLVGLVSPGRGVLSTYEGGTFAYTFYPDGEALVAPGPGMRAVVLPSGEIAWTNIDGDLFHPDGSVILPLLQGRQPSIVTAYGDGKPQYVTFFDVPGLGTQYLLELDNSGNPVAAFRLPGREVANWGVLAGRGLFFGRYRPEAQALDANVARIDLNTGVRSPVYELQSIPGFADALNLVVAGQSGVFVKVINAGSCLNVRSDASLGAPVLECAADGVLLRTDGATASDGVNTFLHVFTPVGVEGWASIAYLER